MSHRPFSGPTNLLLALLFACLSASGAWAADGAALYTGGNMNGVNACVACHGEKGEGVPDSGFPRIAGLDAGYIAQQLQNFAEDRRNDEIMKPVAKALQPDERKAVADYIGSVAAPPAPIGEKPDEKTIAAGAVLTARGDWAKGVAPCAQCHGVKGEGLGSEFPALAGQSAQYIENQIAAWKDGRRGNDPLGLMTNIANRLDEAQIKAAAAYYQSLPPAPPAGTDKATASGQKEAAP